MGAKLLNEKKCDFGFLSPSEVHIDFGFCVGELFPHTKSQKSMGTPIEDTRFRFITRHRRSRAWVHRGNTAGMVIKSTFVYLASRVPSHE